MTNSVQPPFIVEMGDRDTMLKKGEDEEGQENKIGPESLSEPSSNEVGSHKTYAIKCEDSEQMDSNQLREKVEQLNDAVQELEEELDQKSNEVNAKNEHLRRNAYEEHASQDPAERTQDSRNDF